MKFRPFILIWALSSLGIGVLAHADEGMGQPFFGVSDERVKATQLQPSAFYQQKERGWFWYEDPEEEPVEEEPESKPLPEIKPLKPEMAEKKDLPPVKPLSSEWFRANLTRFRDQAVDDPTPENVSQYMYLQRVMLDKAERFTDVTKQVVMADPLLDENSRRPIATFGANALDEQAELGLAKVAKQLSKEAGLWFFYSSTCTFCIKQAGVLKGLANAYGFKILPIALDGLPLPDNSFPNFTVDNGQSKKLGVDTTPALFLVKPGNNGDVIQIGQGLLSGDDIVKRAVVLGYQHGWIGDADYNGTLKAKPITVDQTTLQMLNDDDLNSPGVLVSRIKENLRTQQRKLSQ
ncbi:conjugal transfer protein TraF [Methylovulum psychrotolerans]|uniref:Conjugal transfer protein TraF n=1 Tax=Methylovulum psychrotolerans TaxID=1704499 RepID=A0A2S5CIT5_9GAMM|nr:conjugal transfer protein TraF [Methylovulum psychrotolerans]POZ50667.1 hypothetical protein AADEFJLK_03564 [Methylovulum psychrotolerans]